MLAALIYVEEDRTSRGKAREGVWRDKPRGETERGGEGEDPEAT